MAKLSEPHKRFIVGRLAQFYTPTEVVEAVKLVFGLQLTRQQVAFYDPSTAEGERLSGEFKAFFHATRRRFLENVETIPVSHAAYRLRKLQDLIDRAKDPRLVAELLEQAAKERGGAFTNRQDVSITFLKKLADDVNQMTNEQILGLLAGAGDPDAPGGGGGGA